MLLQATAGLRALEGDASDRILQAVTTSVSFSINVLAAMCNLLCLTFSYFGFR